MSRDANSIKGKFFLKKNSLKKMSYAPCTYTATIDALLGV